MSGNQRTDPKVGGGTSLGRLLRGYRERALLTQEELAVRAGVSVGAVAGIESGRTRRPRSGSVRMLADALDLVGEDRAALIAASQPDATRAVTVATPVVRPAQLPADLAEFSGRAGYLTRLDALLPDGPDIRPATVVISAIAGTAGIGKTTLAVRWAHRVARRFDDGQLYVNLRGFDPLATPMDPAEAIRGLLEALGVASDRQPASLAGQVGLYRSLLAGRRVLVVLDNARDADQVRPLLPSSPGCLALVTSRNQLTGLIAAEAAHPITLDLLPAAEARQLLRRRLGADRVAAEPDAVDELIAGCAGLPLALAIAAARAATYPDFPLQALATQFRTAGGGLEALAGGEAAIDLRAVFSWSYRGLGVEAARLFRLLGLPAGPDIATAAAASLAGIAPTRARALLGELSRAQLLTEHTPGRYRFHDLLRAYAAELSHTHDTERERAEARRRLLDHYLHTSRAASLLISPARDPISLSPSLPGVSPETLAGHRQAMAWFTTEQPALLAAIDDAAGHGFDAHVWQLAWAIANVLHLRGLSQAQIATHHIGLVAARRLGDRCGEAHIHHGLAGGYARAGNYHEAHAHYRHALARFGELGEHRCQATAHLGIGWVSQRQGRHREALAHGQQALDLYRMVADGTGQARALNNIGWESAQLGDYPQALSYCQEALALHRAGGDLRGQATAWDSLGYAHHHLGDHSQAAACYRHALDRFREHGDRLNEAETLVRLGDTHQAAGDGAAARDAWQQAAKILDELDHPDTDQVRAKLM
jgi:tetratricopeptide (TPR) repeat protein/transcriptional regulator with XRE-family HTH domain